MASIKIVNKTKWDIGFLSEYANKLKPFLGVVSGKSYPFKVTVIKKKDFYDRSFFDLGNNELTLKIDLTKQSKEDVAWVLIHEFAHFLSANNSELKKTCLGEEQDSLEQILGKVYDIDKGKVHEIFHDFLPVEVAANFFATMLIGKFHKRHPFSNVEKFRQSRGNSAAKKK